MNTISGGGSRPQQPILDSRQLSASPGPAVTPLDNFPGLPGIPMSEILDRIPLKEKSTFKTLCLVSTGFYKHAAELRDTSELLERSRELSGKPVNAVNLRFGDIMAEAGVRLASGRNKALVLAELARQIIWLLPDKAQIWFDELLTANSDLPPADQDKVLVALPAGLVFLPAPQEGFDMLLRKADSLQPQRQAAVYVALASALNDFQPDQRQQKSDQLMLAWRRLPPDLRLQSTEHSG